MIFILPTVFGCIGMIVEILSDYVHYAILILRLWLEYTFVKSYTNTLVISNIVSVCSNNNIIMYTA